MATPKNPHNQESFTVTAAQHGGLPGILRRFYCRSSASPFTHTGLINKSPGDVDRDQPSRRLGGHSLCVHLQKMSHGVKVFICCNAELSLSVTYLSLAVPHPLPGALGLFISNNHQLPCS